MLAPFAQQIGLGAQRLDRLQRRDRFDQQRLALRRFVHGGSHPLADAPLCHQPDNDGDNEGHSRYDHQPAANGVDDQQEDENESRVDEHADGVRGEELAHEFILCDAVRIFARRSRPRRQGRVEHFLEQQIGNPEIRLASGIVDQRGAGRLQQQVEQDGRADPERQHPEGRDRLVRQDAVVDVHGEDRRGDRQEVDEDRRQHDL